MLGAFCESFATITFAFLINIKDPFTFGVSCFLIKMIDGFGKGCLSSSTNSLISYHYEEEQSRFIGITLTFTGIGMCAGPTLGAWLFTWGGFSLPFLLFGVLLGGLVLAI